MRLVVMRINKVRAFQILDEKINRFSEFADEIESIFKGILNPFPYVLKNVLIKYDSEPSDNSIVDWIANRNVFDDFVVVDLRRVKKVEAGDLEWTIRRVGATSIKEFSEYLIKLVENARKALESARTLLEKVENEMEEIDENVEKSLSKIVEMSQQFNASSNLLKDAANQLIVRGANISQLVKEVNTFNGVIKSFRGMSEGDESDFRIASQVIEEFLKEIVSVSHKKEEISSKVSNLIERAKEKDKERIIREAEELPRKYERYIFEAEALVKEIMPRADYYVFKQRAVSFTEDFSLVTDKSNAFEQMFSDMMRESLFLKLWGYYLGAKVYKAQLENVRHQFQIRYNINERQAPGKIQNNWYVEKLGEVSMDSISTGDIYADHSNVVLGENNTVITSLRSSGKDELAQTLKALTDAILASKDLPSEQKEEQVQIVNQIGEEAAKSKSNKTMLKILSDGLLATLQAIPDIATAITAAMPILSQLHL